MQVSNAPFVEAADNFLSKRDAMDVAMIFQSEKELDQSLYFIVMHYKIRYVTHYAMASFQTGDTNFERFLPKNQNTQRKLLDFENWCSRELSKNEHNFSIKVVQKLMLSKNFNTKKLAFFREKKRKIFRLSST